MRKNKEKENNTQRMVVLAFLSALIIVLQFTSSFMVKLGFFSISLVLIPITLGAVMYGVRAGAFLGAVFGVVCLIAGAVGIDAGTLTMIQFNFWYTAVISIVKGAAAGALSALVYKLFTSAFDKQLPAIIGASIITPIANTLIYLFGMAVLFKDYVVENMQVSDSISAFGIITLIVGLIWVNFVIELLINLIICPIICTALLKNGKLKRIR